LAFYNHFSFKKASILISLHIKSLNISDAFLTLHAHKINFSKRVAVSLSYIHDSLNTARISDTIMSAQVYE